MTSIELAGAAMMQQQEGSRLIATAMLNGLRTLGRRLGFTASTNDTLTGASFIEQEPDLAKEFGGMPLDHIH